MYAPKPWQRSTPRSNGSKLDGTPSRASWVLKPLRPTHQMKLRPKQAPPVEAVGGARPHRSKREQMHGFAGLFLRYLAKQALVNLVQKVDDLRGRHPELRFSSFLVLFDPRSDVTGQLSLGLALLIVRQCQHF